MILTILKPEVFRSGSSLQHAHHLNQDVGIIFLLNRCPMAIISKAKRKESFHHLASTLSFRAYFLNPVQVKPL